MNDEIYDDTIIERACESAFGLKLSIREVIARDISTGYTSTATVFKTSPTVLYIFIKSQSAQTLADVRAIVRNMNIDADKFIAPHGDAEYFKRIGVEKFKSLFPGKHIVSDDDTRYYQTLAPYNPALIRVAKVKGTIRSFHYESKSWRKARDYTFNKIPLVQ
jgi:hypothetical protein